MRICDICPRLEDSMCIVALHAFLIRGLLRLDRGDSLPDEPLTKMVAESRWRAQRYGVLAFFGNMQMGGRMDIDDFVRRVVEEVAPDARELGCEDEAARAFHLSPRSRGRPADRV